MKKLLIAAVTLVMGMSMMSCNNGSAPAKGDGADSAATTEKVEKVEKKVDLAEVVAKAKAEGANWTVDEWKASFRDVIIGCLPMFNYMKDMQEKMKAAEGGDDAAKTAAALQALGDLEAKAKEFEPIEKLMGEYEEIAKKTANGKAVMEDKEFEEQLKKEFDLPEDM